MTEPTAPDTYLTLGQALKAIMHNVHCVSLGDASAHRGAHGCVHAGSWSPHIQDGQGDVGLQKETGQKCEPQGQADFPGQPGCYPPRQLPYIQSNIAVLLVPELSRKFWERLDEKVQVLTSPGISRHHVTARLTSTARWAGSVAASIRVLGHQPASDRSGTATVGEK